MPGYRVHLVGGLIACGSLCALISFRSISLPVAAEWLIFSLLGALFPDIDIKSKGRTVFYKIAFCIAFLLIYKHQIAFLLYLAL